MSARLAAIPKPATLCSRPSQSETLRIPVPTGAHGSPLCRPQYEHLLAEDTRRTRGLSTNPPVLRKQARNPGRAESPFRIAQYSSAGFLVSAGASCGELSNTARRHPYSRDRVSSRGLLPHGGPVGELSRQTPQFPREDGIYPPFHARTGRTTNCNR